ncbi:MAG TPA: hypothetical protein VGB91_01835 [Rhizomicrobium sp.]
MAKQPTKPHDLRDDIYAPRTTVTDTNERLAGAEPPAIDPENGDFPLVTPEPGKNLPPGQAVKG